MYLTAWVNQFEIKDTCIGFMTYNVSAQSNNNMKIRLNLNVEKIYTNYSPNFLWNKWHIHNPIKHIIWSVLQKQSMVEYSQLFLQNASS